MNNKKTRIIIGIMAGLVLFSSSVALLLYLKQGKTPKHQQKNIEVFVAAQNLKKGELLNADALKKAQLPKSYISFTPLTDTEIIGRYASVDIYKDEPIRREKIASSKPVKTKKTVVHAKPVKVEPIVQQIEQITQDRLSVPLSMFRNNNTRLKAGEYVDIATVIPSKKKTDNFSTKYLALHVKIIHFLSNGQVLSTLVSQNEKKQTLRADTIVLNMTPKEMKNFLAYYYTTQTLNSNRLYNLQHYGGHLWLIKTPKAIDETLQKEKKLLMVGRKVYKKRAKKKQNKVSISYEN